MAEEGPLSAPDGSGSGTTATTVRPRRVVRMVPEVVRIAVTGEQPRSSHPKLCECLLPGCRPQPFTSATAKLAMRHAREAPVGASRQIQRSSKRRKRGNSSHSQARNERSLQELRPSSQSADRDNFGAVTLDGEISAARIGLTQPANDSCIIAFVNSNWFQGRLLLAGQCFQPAGLYGTLLPNAEPEDYMDRCMIDIHDPPSLYQVTIIDFERDRKITLGMPFIVTGGDSARIRSDCFNFYCHSFATGDSATLTLEKYFPSLVNERTVTREVVVCHGEVTIGGELKTFVDDTGQVGERLGSQGLCNADLQQPNQVQNSKSRVDPNLGKEKLSQPVWSSEEDGT